uniref:Uncharacterized protein n=1 Tax=Davidia involucrata TaxID=16924 RepID=A0A5B7C6V8_DAVIN
MQFLMGLNESYSAIRGQILLMNPLPNVTKAYSSIVQEEKQQSLSAARETTETAAMAVRRDEPAVMPAVRQGQGSSSSSNSSNRTPLHCSYCDQDHHVRDTCWKLNGYPPGHPKHKSNRSNLCKPFLIRIRLVAQRLVDPPRVIVFFWDLLLFSGGQRGRKPCLSPQQKSNIEP